MGNFIDLGTSGCLFGKFIHLGTSGCLFVEFYSIRYFRLLYLNEYSNKVHVWKVNVAALVAFLVALLHGLVQTTSISYNLYSEVSVVPILRVR